MSQEFIFFAILVSDMRVAQEKYYTTGDAAYLDQAKSLEKDVDSILAYILTALEKEKNHS